MPHGQKDFWPGTSIAMPAVGAGQIPWFMSEAHLVPDGETYDLINYVVPDTFELHVCSGVVSCGTPRTQRYDLRQTPGATWIDPTSHIDPDGVWLQPEYAYDGDTNTHALTPAAVGAWTSFLELLVNEQKIDKIKFWAFYRALDINEIDVDVYYNGGWVHVYEGAFTDSEWVEKDILAGANLISKARVRFYNGGIYDYWGFLKEFRFDTAEVTAQEGIWFDTHAIIPYTAQAPYIVEPKATFAVRVYNDDDLDADMSVALAGFLQPAII